MCVGKWHVIATCQRGQGTETDAKTKHFISLDNKGEVEDTYVIDDAWWIA